MVADPSSPLPPGTGSTWNVQSLSATVTQPARGGGSNLRNTEDIFIAAHVWMGGIDHAPVPAHTDVL